MHWIFLVISASIPFLAPHTVPLEMWLSYWCLYTDSITSRWQVCLFPGLPHLFDMAYPFCFSWEAYYSLEMAEVFIAWFIKQSVGLVRPICTSAELLISVYGTFSFYHGVLERHWRPVSLAGSLALPCNFFVIEQKNKICLQIHTDWLRRRFNIGFFSWYAAILWRQHASTASSWPLKDIEQ